MAVLSIAGLTIYPPLEADLHAYLSKLSNRQP